MPSKNKLKFICVNELCSNLVKFKEAYTCGRTCSNYIFRGAALENLNKKSRKPRPDLVACNACGKTIPLRKHARAADQVCFDDLKCRAIGSSQQDLELDLWLNNKVSADASKARRNGSPALTKYARIFLLIEADWKCSRCSWAEPHPDSGLPPLEIDHIDGNGFNNFRNNLRVLCPNCHSLTPTYRRKNGKNDWYSHSDLIAA